MAEVVGLKTYPVKGLSPMDLDEVTITAGEAFPNDRIFGLARVGNMFDPANPRPLSKDKFWVLAHEQRLAQLRTRFNEKTMEFFIEQQDTSPVVFNLSSDKGKRDLESFIATFLDLPEGEMPTLYYGNRHRFTDVSVVSDEMMHAISLINKSSVRKFEEDTGLKIDPGRFRGNIIIDNMPPFAELDLVGRTLKIGQLSFEAVRRTKRCPATEVNPETAERDIKVPYLLRKHYGHFDMGVYLMARDSGNLSLNDMVEII